MTDTALRIGIADDDALVRHALTALLVPALGVQVVWSVSDGASAVQACQDPGSAVDVLLLDMQMPVLDGLGTLDALHASMPNLPIVMLTTFDTGEKILEALNRGARGYFVKDDDPLLIASGLRSAHGGAYAFSPTASIQVVDGFKMGSPGAAPAATMPNPAAIQVNLTAREQQVLALLATSMSNKQIARELFISEATVKTHVSVIIAKLGVPDRVGAAVWAFRTGLA